MYFLKLLICLSIAIKINNLILFIFKKNLQIYSCNYLTILLKLYITIVETIIEK